jgi:radical SAM protein with 4Fe4S-binding SPASM domain
MHCSSGSNYGLKKGELEPEEILRLIREARNLGATILSLSGGDPILDPNVFDYIIKALDLEYEKILFYTTGFYRHYMYVTMKLGPENGIPEEWFDNLLSHWDEIGNDLRARLVFVYSLESHRPEVNDYIMGYSGAWEMIVGNIRRTIARGFQVNIHMVPMLPNWDHGPELRMLCATLGVSQMSMLRFVPQTRGKVNNRRLAINREEFRALQQIMEGMSKDVDPSMPSDPHPVDVRFGCPIDFRHTLGMYGEKQHQCHAGKDLILVRPDGSVHPCAAWKTLPGEDNIRSKSLVDIWRDSRVFNGLRSFHETGWNDLRGRCGRCMYAESCQGGCIAQRLHSLRYEVEIKDICTPVADPMCPIRDL